MIPVLRTAMTAADAAMKPGTGCAGQLNVVISSSTVRSTGDATTHQLVLNLQLSAQRA